MATPSSITNFLNADSIQSNINSAISSVKNGIIPAVSSNPLVNSAVNSAKYDSTAANTERLYTIQPRSAAGLYNGTSKTDRGDIASIRLINPNNVLQSDINKTDKRYSQMSPVLDYSVYQDMLAGTYDHFLLHSCEASFTEKTQIMTTFGDQEVVYFFGKNPVIMNLTGTLIDSLQNNWFTDFVNVYQTFLRGTKLAQNFEMIELILPNMRLTGSILSLNYQQGADRDTNIAFSMQFYAKEMVPLLQPILNGVSSNLYVNANYTPVFSATKVGPSLPTTKSTTTSGFVEPAWMKNLTAGKGPSNPLAISYQNFFANSVMPSLVKTLATVTKVVGAVAGGVSSALNLIESFTAPLNTAITTVTSIATTASSLSTLITQEAGALGKLLGQPVTNLKNMISSLKNAAGSITRLPQSVSQAFQSNAAFGRIGGGAGILSSGSSGTTKSAALSSGKPYTAKTSFSI